MTEAAQASASPARGCDEANSPDACSAFDCNICLSQAKDPVVTLCGHLYCWPCLYRWLETPSSSHNCPVCNAGVESSKVIPLYGRGCEQTDPRKKEVVIPQDLIVPRRPAGQRPHSMQRSRGLYGLHNMNPIAALALLSGSQAPGSEIPFQYQVTPDQQHRVFLQRLMLLGGSMIILFLLLF